MAEAQTKATPESNETYDYFHLSDRESLRAHYPALAEAVTALEQYSELGKRIVDWARTAAKISCRERPILTNALGYYSTQRRIDLNIENGAALNFSVLAHELMHAVQDLIWKRLVSNKSASYQALVSHTLCLEAAAETAAIRMAFEAKLNGYPDGFDCISNEENNAYAVLFRKFEHTYNQAISAGQSKNNAIQEACDQAYTTYMASQRLRDIYNRTTLAKYTTDLLRYQKMNKFPEPHFDEQTAQGMTELGDNEFLVTAVKMPVTDKELFGSNNLLRQAFEYIELHHILWWAGENRTNFGVLRKKAELQADNNPYLKAHFADRNKGRDKPIIAEALEEYERQMAEIGKANMFEILNKIIGIDDGPQLCLDFTQVANDNVETESAPDEKVVAATRLSTPAPARPMFRPG